MSKTLATIVTQPLIVAKVGLQSKPPPDRKGRPFKTFVEVMRHIIDREGALALFKGIGPQILKGLLVQGILMMTKERMELFFVVLFAHVRRRAAMIRDNEAIRQAADSLGAKAKTRSIQLKEKADAVGAASQASKVADHAARLSRGAKNLVPITQK
jgi:Mitochondrial carrier protein